MRHRHDFVGFIPLTLALDVVYVQYQQYCSIDDALLTRERMG